MQILRVLLWCALLCACGAENVLSSADFSGSVTKSTYVNSNVVGVSMTLPDVIPYLTNPVFIARINVTRFGGWYSNMFSQYVHVPKGYKYNCSTVIYGGNVSCLLDLALNPAVTSALYTLIYDYSNYGAFDLGVDFERSNFTNTSKYFINFKTYFNLYASSGVTLELLDYGDQTSAIYNRTYTAANFLSDVGVVYSGTYLYADGPGITEAADSSWVASLPDLYNNYYCTFSFRCTVFKNSSQATIANLMSEAYNAAYLKARMVDQANKTLNFASYAIAINDIRLTNDSGVDGVTNSFAAALWALDLSVAFAMLPGYSINFYNPLTPSNQSIFGAGPGFLPGAMYYGILLGAYALRFNPYIDTVSVTAGSSGSIKVYGLDAYQGYRFLLINKDMNPNASGVVNVKHSYTLGFRCIYLSAPALNSTANITFAGMSFVANSTDYVGAYTYVDYMPTPMQVYSFHLNYSQAALCEELPDPSGVYTQLPRTRSQLAQPHLLSALLLLLALLALH